MQLLKGRYKFEKVLGQGGMGKVYLTKDIQTGEKVAVKECFVQGKENKNFAERVRREYYFMTKIQHPNIIKAFDFFENKGRYFIVMEYVKGITLQDLIRHFPKSISFEQQLIIIKEICSAVIVLSESGIIHRDLKPDNIMLVGEKLKPKLLDLGIAKDISEELETITNTGLMVGTPDYMSPEQMKEDLKVGKNSDVFSLGVIFYQFLSWNRNSPFYGGNLISTMTRITELELPGLSSIIDTKSNSVDILSEILDYSLKKDPLQRLSCVKDFLRKLNSIPNSSEKKKLPPTEIDGTRTFDHRKKRKLKQKRKEKNTNKKKRSLKTLSWISFCSVFLSVVILYNIGFSQQNNLNQKPKKDAESKRNTKNSNTNIELIHSSEDRKNKSNDQGKLEIEDNLKRKSSKAITLFESAHFFFNQKKYDLAVKDYTKAIDFNPKYSKAYHERGRSLQVQKKYDLAIRDYNKAIELNSKHFLIYHHRGVTFSYQKKYDLAIKDYTKAIELNSKHGQAYNNRGVLFLRKGKYDLAIKDFNKAIEINPKDGQVYKNRGGFFLQVRKYDLAIKDYTKAIEFGYDVDQANKFIKLAKRKLVNAKK
ncbi:protein kinase [Candidatus Uabimicrobium sp. HlEnr_7]|uniref:serine/threonine-protein kinase n=1 Tax=Candidatus Uabimicrobium helgolandensis TaxID=3095367 RepID=UPI0035578D92